MRISLAVTVLLMVAIQLLFVMTGKGQNIATEKVTLGLKDESLETAIKKIEQQSAFRFFYRNEDIRPLDHLYLILGTRTIEQTLKALLQNFFLSFRQIDRNILLERKDRQIFFEIRGRILDSADKMPVANASVFLNNSTIGMATANNGSFTLNIARAGKYELVVSIIGYAAYKKTIFIDRNDIMLPDIEIAPKTITLAEVKVKTDPNWGENYSLLLARKIKADPNWETKYSLFKRDFLGTSKQAAKCTILNPGVLDLNYNEKTGTLSASSTDFLVIENQALGYKLKYLLTQFSSNKQNEKVNYKGSALFETLPGDQVQQRKWQKSRLKTYKGSTMHFLRSVLYNQLAAEGFQVLRLKRKLNPYDPTRYLDSLAETPLQVYDFVRLCDKKGIYALCFKDCLYVMYTKLHNDTGNLISIPASLQPNYAKTTLTIVDQYIFFDDDGIIMNPESIVFDGYWAASRVAEVLPSDYSPDN